MATTLDPLSELIALEEAHLASLVRARLRQGEVVKLPPPMPLDAFVLQAWDKVDPQPYVHGKHIEVTCAHLEAVAQGQIRQLLINIPPRYSKSLICAVMFPAWVWTWWPSAKFIYVSYSSALSMRDALKARDLMYTPWYRRTFAPSWELKEDQNAKGRYENTAQGFRVSTSVGAMATGEGGDFVIGDDLHAVDEAYSATRADIQAAVDFWRTTMPSRVTNWKTTCRVVVGQRIAEDDVSGTILAQDAYEYLVLPQRYVPPGPGVPVSQTSLGFVDWRTHAGELLCPARMGETEDAALTLSPQARAAQFQQQPTSDATSLFKLEDWRIYHAMPPIELFDFVVQSWDMATKKTATSSHVAGHVWGFKAVEVEGVGRCYAPWLLDRVYARMDFPETVQAVEDLSEAWPTVERKLIEDKANGTPVYAVLRGTMPGLVPIDPGKYGGKKQRAEAVAWLQRKQLAWVPAPALKPWVTEYMHLMQRFAGDPRDEADDVDATSQAWRLALPAPKEDLVAKQRREHQALRQKIFLAAQRTQRLGSKSRI